jgi:hypothetical protein
LNDIHRDLYQGTVIQWSRIQNIDYRGRAAASAPPESCLASNAGLQGPLFTTAHAAIEAFPTQTLFVRELSFSAASFQP